MFPQLTYIYMTLYMKINGYWPNKVSLLTFGNTCGGPKSFAMVTGSAQTTPFLCGLALGWEDAVCIVVFPILFTGIEFSSKYNHYHLMQPLLVLWLRRTKVFEGGRWFPSRRRWTRQSVDWNMCGGSTLLKGRGWLSICRKGGIYSCKK